MVAGRDLLHADAADHAERGEVPLEGRRLHGGDAGLAERPLDARAGGLDGEAVLAMRVLDRVADLGDAVGGMAVEDDAADHLPLVLQKDERVAPQARLGIGDDRIAGVGKARDQELVARPRGRKRGADDRLGARLVTVDDGEDRVERDRDQAQAVGVERGHQGPVFPRPSMSASVVGLERTPGISIWQSRASSE